MNYFLILKYPKDILTVCIFINLCIFRIYEDPSIYKCMDEFMWLRQNDNPYRLFITVRLTNLEDLLISDKKIVNLI